MRLFVVQMVTVNGKRQLVQTTFESMGRTSLLEYGPLGTWRFLECSKQFAPGDVFRGFGPVHCHPVSSGTSNPPLCSTKTSQSTCTASPACGWCGKSMKCYSGSGAGVCNNQDPTCPAAEWVFVGGEDTRGAIDPLKDSATTATAGVHRTRSE